MTTNTLSSEPPSKRWEKAVVRIVREFMDDELCPASHREWPHPRRFLQPLRIPVRFSNRHGLASIARAPPWQFRDRFNANSVLASSTPANSVTNFIATGSTYVANPLVTTSDQMVIYRAVPTDPGVYYPASHSTLTGTSATFAWDSSTTGPTRSRGLSLDAGKNKAGTSTTKERVSNTPFRWRRFASVRWQHGLGALSYFVKGHWYTTTIAIPRSQRRRGELDRVPRSNPHALP